MLSFPDQRGHSRHPAAPAIKKVAANAVAMALGRRSHARSAATAYKNSSTSSSEQGWRQKVQQRFRCNGVLSHRFGCLGSSSSSSLQALAVETWKLWVSVSAAGGGMLGMLSPVFSTGSTAKLLAANTCSMQSCTLTVSSGSICRPGFVLSAPVMPGF